MKIKKEEKVRLIDLIKDDEDDDLDEPNPLDFKAMVDLIKGQTEEDIEYEESLTEEERKEELEEKLNTKKYIIKVSVIIGVLMVGLVTGSIFLIETFKSDLYKITKPMLKEYYDNKYSSNISISNIENICYTKKDTREEVCDGLVLATTKENKHIMAINNKNIGDDNNTKLVNSIDEFIKNEFSGVERIYESAIYSYKDYYYDYNLAIPYINVLPNTTIDKITSSGKLTIQYKAIYLNDLDAYAIQRTIQKYSDDSKFYFIKQTNGIPSKLTVITKNKINEINIVSNKELDDGIYNYNFDQSQNLVNLLKLTKHAGGTIQSDGKFKSTNVIEIDFDTRYQSKDEEVLPTYFLVKLKNGIISENNVKQFSLYGDEYDYIREENYENIIIFSFGGSTYIIGEKPIILGNIKENSSFLCNLGLC